MDIEEAIILAKKEDTPSKILFELCQKYHWGLGHDNALHYNGAKEEECRHYILFKNILSNPNTSSEVLKKYFNRFPIQILNNISFSLFILEEPDFLSNFDYWHPYKFFDQRDLPIWFLKWAANHNDVLIRGAVAFGKSTPIHILEKLSWDCELKVRNYLRCNKSCPERIKARLSKEPLEYSPF